MNEIVKLCGMTRTTDLSAAADAGADFAGIIVEYPLSPRSRTAEETEALAAHAALPIVLVVVDHDTSRLSDLIRRTGAAAIQLAGSEGMQDVAYLARVHAGTELEIWKVLHVSASADAVELEAVLAAARAYEEAGVRRVVLDARHPRLAGGSGLRVDWTAAAEIVHHLSVPVVLAGGLVPENVGAAIAGVRPAGVDVASGIEASPSIKDAARMRSFVAAARSAFGKASDSAACE